MPYILTKYNLCATFPPLVLWVYLYSNFSDDLQKADAYRLGLLPFEVIQGHRFKYQSKVRVNSPISVQ